MKLFGTSGIRRIADRELYELAFNVGLAVGRLYGSVVVGRDTRTSGDVIKHAFMSGVLASGATCSDCGIVPTPTLALAAADFEAGAVITASHNPPEYNGIKLVNPDGSAFSSEQENQIEELVAGENIPVSAWQDIGPSITENGIVEKHIGHILKNISPGRNIKVVLDCGGGAGSVITPELLKRLGCEVLEMNCFPTGFFPRAVEPLPENLTDLIQATREMGADLGIAHDGDADRMMAVDDKGRFIPGDKLLVLFSQHIGAKEVVTTLDASMVIDDMGFDIARTPVGDTHVSNRLKISGQFGGEPSGSWIFPENSLCPDGIYAAARMVSIARDNKISELMDNIPQYPILRGSVVTQGPGNNALDEKLLSLKPVSVNNIDGTRLRFEDGWLLIRASGTEPKIRITAEAKTESRLHEIYDSGLNIINESIRETGGVSG
ncbi:phosphoglucosamine mutase [Chloroflexota bacterium]